MNDLLVGIDAGTSVIKAVAFDLCGRQIAVAAIPNRYETLAGGGAEQDLARTWAETATTLQQLADKVENLAARTVAVAVTGQGDGTWLVDAAGDPVGRAWLWLDARSAPRVERLSALPGDSARFASTATGLNACQTGPQLGWMDERTPEVLDRAATAFHCKDWLYFRLTGARATDVSEGTFSFGDFRTRAYSDAVIDFLGLTHRRSLLPPIVDGTMTHVPLSAAAASVTGLRPGTPVVLAYVDVACTALGAGLYDPAARPGCTIIGSTGMHMTLAPTPGDVVLGPERTGYTMALPAPGAYAQIQSNMAATINIDWVLGLARGILESQGITRSAPEMLGLVDEWMADSAPGAILYQPYISEAGERGPFIDARARAGFIGLSTRHGYADMVRAVFEGLGFAARDCYTAMAAAPSEIRLTGGAARSPALRRILAAATGARIRSGSREEAGAAGAAMIAAVSIGVYPDMAACCADWVTPLLGATEAPDPALAATYARLYPAYADARQALRPVWHAMADARAEA